LSTYRIFRITPLPSVLVLVCVIFRVYGWFVLPQNAGSWLGGTAGRSCEKPTVDSEKHIRARMLRTTLEMFIKTPHEQTSATNVDSLLKPPSFGNPQKRRVFTNFDARDSWSMNLDKIRLSGNVA